MLTGNISRERGACVGSHCGAGKELQDSRQSSLGFLRPHCFSKLSLPPPPGHRPSLPRFPTSWEDGQALEGWVFTGGEELPLRRGGRKGKSCGSEAQTSRRGSSCGLSCQRRSLQQRQLTAKSESFGSAYKTCKLLLHSPPPLGDFSLWFPFLPLTPYSLRPQPPHFGKFKCFF